MFKKIKKSIGLEISNSYIRVVELSSFRGLREIRTSNELKLEQGVVVDGVIKDKKVLAKSLRKAFQESSPLPIKNKEIHFALPDELTYISLIRSQVEDNKGIKQIINEEYSKNIPIKQEDSEYSYKVLDKLKNSENEESVEALLVTALRKSLLSWQNFFEDNGFKIDYFDVDILANFRSQNKKHPSDTNAYINIKEDYSRFSIFSEHGLEYEYTLRYGRLKIAENLGPDLNSASILGFVEDIKENIAYFENLESVKERDLNIAKIHLSGSLKEVTTLKDYFLNHEAGTVVDIAKNVFAGSDIDPSFNQAIGLALRPWEHYYEKTDPFLACIGHAYSLESNIKGNEEAIINFLYKTKNIIIIPLALVAFIFFGWLSMGLINGSDEAEQIETELSPKTEEPEIFAPPPKEEKKDVFVVVDDIGIPLNVRGGPSTSYKIIGQVDPGSEQVLIKEEGGWFNIEWPNEESAWISGSYANVIK